MVGGTCPRSPAPSLGSDMANAARPLQERPEGWQDFARNVVCEAEAMLWLDQGSKARDYLSHRGLQDDTIRAARLGYWPEDKWFKSIYPDRLVLVPSGIIIPWFDGSEITMINVRRAEGAPKYLAVRGSRRGGIFPGREVIVNRRAVVIVEGELDALLMGQELRDMAAVVTLGGASNRPSTRIKNALLAASPWIVACDSDAAGEDSANDWLTQSERCVRVVTPTGYGKDWTEAHQKGLDLRGWWRRELERIVGQQGRPRLPPEIPVEKARASRGIASLLHSLTGVIMPDPPSSPSLEEVGYWTDDWRLRWGAISNSYCHQGMRWWDAELRAAEEVAAEREAANGGPPPVMDPDPYTALWRDILEELISGGQASRYLPASELKKAQDLLLETPLNCEAIRAAARKVMSPDSDQQSGTLGIPRKRWQCGNRYCLHKGPWWKSIYGVINCKNCRAPSFEWQIVEEGDASNAPLAEPTGANEPVTPIRPERVSRPAEANHYPLFTSPREVNPLPSSSTL